MKHQRRFIFLIDSPSSPQQEGELIKLINCLFFVFLHRYRQKTHVVVRCAGVKWSKTYYYYLVMFVYIYTFMYVFKYGRNK